MKTTLRMSRWFGALAALLLLTVSSFTLTSCDDDDDLAGVVMIGGEKFKVTSVDFEERIITATDGTEVKCYYIYLDGEDDYAEIDLAEPLFGKTLNLAKDQTYYDGYGNSVWYTGVEIWFYDKEEGEWDSKCDAWTEDDGAFKSGTLYVSLSGSSATIKAQGVTGDGKSFSINYSGKCTVYEDSDVKSEVNGKVKGKNQVKKNK